MIIGGLCFIYDKIGFTVKISQSGCNTLGGGASSPGLDVRRCRSLFMGSVAETEY